MSEPEIPAWDWMEGLPEEEQQKIVQLIKGQESYRNAAPTTEPAPEGPQKEVAYLEPITKNKEKP